MKRTVTQFKRYNKQPFFNAGTKKARVSHSSLEKKMLFIDANEFLYATAAKFASISLDDYLALNTTPKYYASESILTIASTGTTKKSVAR